MLSPQAGAVLLNTFLSMHKKCFNYFELNWKFICKRVIFKKYQHCFSPNGEWILSFKKKEKKNATASIDLRSWRDQGWRFPFFSRPIAKFVPLVLSAWRFHQLRRLSAYRITVCRSPPATQAISVSNRCLQILSSRTALTNSKYNFFSQSFRVQFLGRRTSTALGVSAAPTTVLTPFTYKS